MAFPGRREAIDGLQGHRTYMTHSGIQLSRRELVQAGSLGLVGLSLPRLLQADTASIAPRAKSCILFFMEGGPAHQDLWDMKPEAPVEYRGEFKPIASSFTGVPVCEHLPLLSKQMHRFALIRSAESKSGT